MNDLEKYFNENTGRLIDKWQHYFEIYDRHFSRFREKEVVVVEFGVYQGGSLQMWKHYFGPGARIYGIDINPHCKQLEEDRIEIIIGDQEDRDFLRSLASRIPKIDVLIEDGGHTMGQQIATFEEMFPQVAADGIYLCEDLHTSYWPDYGGGLRRRDSFIEYSKHFIDRLNAWHSVEPDYKVDPMTRTAHSLSYYDSVIVIEKRAVEAPTRRKTGVPTIPDWSPPPRPRPGWVERLMQRAGLK